MAAEITYDDGFFDAHRGYFARGLPAYRRFVLEDLQAKSIADFGCGQADWLEPFVGMIPVWGCDGHANEDQLRVPRENFQKIDLSKQGPSDLTVGERDVVMSLEAMEHLECVHESNFLDCMLSPNPRIVIFGVASGRGPYDPTQFKFNRLGEKMPGGPEWKPQWGRHHVNCQPVSVVIEKMAARGYEVDDVLSAQFANLRAPAARKKNGKFAFASFYRKNTRVYRRA